MTSSGVRTLFAFPKVSMATTVDVSLWSRFTFLSAMACAEGFSVKSAPSRTPNPVRCKKCSRKSGFTVRISPDWCSTFTGLGVRDGADYIHGMCRFSHP